MKKFYRLSIVLCLCVLMIISMVACGGKNVGDDATSSEQPFVPTTAAELWNKSDALGDALESYQNNMTIELVYYYYGNKVEATNTSSVVYAVDGMYRMGHYTVVCEEQDMDDTTYMVEAYYDGKLYIANKNDEIDQKLCAVTDMDEYLALEFEEGSVSGDVDFSACTNSTLVHNDDGTWTMQFSGYTKKSIETLMGNAGFNDEMLGATVYDMEIIATTNAEFYPSTIEVKFIFDTTDETVAPVANIRVEYLKLNEAVIDPAVLKPEEYTQVDNVLVLKQLTNSLKSVVDENPGKFLLELEQTVKILDSKDKITEKDTVTYGKTNGSFYYDIDSVYDGVKYTISHRGGTRTVSYDGEKVSEAETEDQAKSMVAYLANSAKYDAMTVTNVTAKEEGVYLLTIEKADCDEVNANFEGTGLSFSSATQEITVTVKDGKVQKIESTATYKGKFKYSGGSEKATMEVESVVDFGVAE